MVGLHQRAAMALQQIVITGKEISRSEDVGKKSYTTYEPACFLPLNRGRRRAGYGSERTMF
jgi:hypothetical protein